MLCRAAKQRQTATSGALSSRRLRRFPGASMLLDMRCCGKTTPPPPKQPIGSQLLFSPSLQTPFYPRVLSVAARFQNNKQVLLVLHVFSQTRFSTVLNGRVSLEKILLTYLNTSKHFAELRSHSETRWQKRLTKNSYSNKLITRFWQPILNCWLKKDVVEYI